MQANNHWRPRTVEELKNQQCQQARQIRENIMARANPARDRNFIRGYN